MKRNNLGIGLVFILILLFLSSSCSDREGETEELAEQGLKYMEQFDFQKAIKNFEIAIERDPNNPNYYCHLGKSYIWFLRTNAEIVLKKDKTQRDAILNKAEQAYRKSLEINSRQICALEGLGELFRFKGEYEKALTQYKIVAQNQPENKMVYQEIGELYIKLDKPELAREAFSLSLIDAVSSTDYKKDYQFISIDKVPIMKSEIIFESNVKWHVVDRIIYEGTLGDIQVAEERMKDLYWGAITLVGHMVKDSSELLSAESKTQILRHVNDYSRKHFGIEIKEINIEIGNTR